jgi:anaerobic selenocysteine-containing dehydrogenase
MSDVVRSQCPYCGVGCGIELTVAAGQVIKVNGDSQHPANAGRLCIKGATVDQTIAGPTRLLKAMLRPDRTEALQAVDLDLALETTAGRLRTIIERDGPGAIAFYVSGQLTTETCYLASKLCKGLLGTNTIDANSRLCMARAVSAYTQAFGSDGPPCSYSDIEAADCFVVIGSNTAECHPIVYRRIEQQVRRHGAQLIVIDPRRTATARYATLHLPVRPGADTALLNGLLHILARDGALDRDFLARHTSGSDAMLAAVAAWTPERTALVTGLEVAQIEAAAALLARSQRTLSLWSMGVNQSRNGVAKAQSIINLHLATGRIGKPGCGPFSLTGQPNAMGGREAGYLAHHLPGHRRVDNLAHRRQIEAAWGLEPGAISPTPGPDAQTMFGQLASGAIKAIWIIGTNPLHSLPNTAATRHALEQAELVIVQDAYSTSSLLPYADIALPAAQWSECSGTFTASDRHITLLNPAAPAPGDAQPDWWLLQSVAQRLGFGLNYPDAEAIWDEYRALTSGGYPLDVSGVSYARLRSGPLQWPCPSEDHPGTERLYADARFATPDGRARCIPTALVEPAELPDAEFPFWLTTGRVLEQWHTRTRTATVPRLNQRHSGSFIEIHPDDAGRLGVGEGEALAVLSRRGACTAPVRLSAEIQRGCVFMPIHWDDGNPNAITSTAVDPLSLQPELKACAVRLAAVVELRLLNLGDVAPDLALVPSERRTQ